MMNDERVMELVNKEATLAVIHNLMGLACDLCDSYRTDIPDNILDRFDGLYKEICSIEKEMLEDLRPYYREMSG